MKLILSVQKTRKQCRLWVIVYKKKQKKLGGDVIVTQSCIIWQKTFKGPI